MRALAEFGTSYLMPMEHFDFEILVSVRINKWFEGTRGCQLLTFQWLE